MRILCVDDEVLVLRLTMDLCHELRQNPEVTGFTRALDALEWLETNAADIILLDINMPDMDGITLATKIKEKHPDTAIVFVTGYSEYAVDAFNLHASGYLLKPMSAERLAEEVDYALSRKPERRQGRIVVKTFGDFDLIVDGKVVYFSRTKSKELLAYLVDRQGRSVTRAALFAALWEEGMYDRSKQKYLDVVIRSLRDTLAKYDAGEILEMGKGGLRIREDKIDCDLYRLLEGDADAINSYRGEYMSSYPWASLTEAYVDRVRNHL